MWKMFAIKDGSYDSNSSSCWGEINLDYGFGSRSRTPSGSGWSPRNSGTGSVCLTFDPGLYLFLSGSEINWKIFLVSCNSSYVPVGFCRLMVQIHGCVSGQAGKSIHTPGSRSIINKIFTQDRKPNLRRWFNQENFQSILFPSLQHPQNPQFRLWLGHSKSFVGFKSRLWPSASRGSVSLSWM